jgi:hypothetical protein
VRLDLEGVVAEMSVVTVGEAARRRNARAAAAATAAAAAARQARRRYSDEDEDEDEDESNASAQAEEAAAVRACPLCAPCRLSFPSAPCCAEVRRGDMAQAWLGGDPTVDGVRQLTGALERLFARVGASVRGLTLRLAPAPVRATSWLEVTVGVLALGEAAAAAAAATAVPLSADGPMAKRVTVEDVRVRLCYPRPPGAPAAAAAALASAARASSSSDASAAQTTPVATAKSIYASALEESGSYVFSAAFAQALAPPPTAPIATTTKTDAQGEAGLLLLWVASVDVRVELPRSGRARGDTNTGWRVDGAMSVRIPITEKPPCVCVVRALMVLCMHTYVCASLGLCLCAPVCVCHPLSLSLSVYKGGPCCPALMAWGAWYWCRRCGWCLGRCLYTRSLRRCAP